MLCAVCWGPVSDGKGPPSGRLRPGDYDSSLFHPERTLPATFVPTLSPFCPDSGHFSPVVWVALALMLPCLWVSPASSLRLDRLSKPQPESVAWALSSRRGVPPNTPLEPLRTDPKDRQSSHWTDAGDQRSPFKGGAQSPRLASKHAVLLGRESRDVNGVRCRARILSCCFLAPPWRVGFRGHVTQFGNSLPTSEDSEEDKPSVTASTRQLAAQLMRPAAPSACSWALTRGLHSGVRTRSSLSLHRDRARCAGASLGCSHLLF